mmetsp:Transcript_14851/g.38342  ORF Transcript_14851/g.38342 Transcript_14851/m.38342 type:complete len:226 (-) Transcript_14851:1342-2019(-)
MSVVRAEGADGARGLHASARGPRARRLADDLWQLLGAVVGNVLLLVVVRCDLDEPLRLYLDDRAHELLGGEHKLVVDDPARLRAVQRRGGMDVHRLRVLDGAVVKSLLQLGCVVEEAGGHGLADRVRVLRVRDDLELDALHQPLELLPDVASLAQRANLDEVLKAPLRRELSLRPLVPHVEQREMVSARPIEVDARIVGVQRALLGPIEDGCADLEHGCDREYLL